MQYVPAVSVYALNLAGVKGRNNLGRATISYAASAVIMGILVNTIKYTAKVERPDGSSNNSFPSGHTSNAFMNATFLHKEYGQLSPMYSIAGYSMSTFTGIGRGLNNRHWISDVLAGAGIGILFTQLGYFFVDKFYGNDGDRPGKYDFEDPLERPSFLSLKVGYAGATRNLVEAYELGIHSKNGFEAGLEGAYYFSQNWGIGADFSFVSFPISTSDSTITDPDFGTSTSSIVTESIGALNFTIGPHFTHALGGKFLMHAKVGAGVLSGATGKLSFKVEDIDNDGNILNDEFEFLRYKPATAFKVNGGLGLTYMLNEELGVTLYSDYHYSKPKFTYSAVDDVSDPDSNINSITQKEKLDYISAGLRLTAFF
ncbi:phosphatase PAP2 family protein [Gelidibacter mesophilus]|uniref:phosphatase PAP2 family protein n=1 Tax=Gelidibacter mesophilus TaxID=169050 RepID=UPI0004041309|nr:phosphatase PAP2 family protein [Gelidibacter mesophilus]